MQRSLASEIVGHAFAATADRIATDKHQTACASPLHTSNDGACEICASQQVRFEQALQITRLVLASGGRAKRTIGADQRINRAKRIPRTLDEARRSLAVLRARPTTTL